MLLQYPVLIGLYMFIPQSIQLRQESFLWATDLSAPDKLLELPFSIPIYGDYVAGFTLLMGLAMLVQMRIQSPPDAGGQQKVFMYFMPAFIFFIFNQFASALSLYYLSYNIVSAAQQQWINMQIEREKGEQDAPGSAAKHNGNGRNGSGKDGGGFLERLRKKVEEAR
jgi:YidC/Oxa1 family membrane protein insertase